MARLAKIGKAVVFGDVGDTRFGVARTRDVGADAAPAAVCGRLGRDRPPAFAHRRSERAALHREGFLLLQRRCRAAGRIPARTGLAGCRLRGLSAGRPVASTKRCEACPRRPCAVDAPEPVGRVRLEIVEQDRSSFPWRPDKQPRLRWRRMKLAVAGDSEALERHDAHRGSAASTLPAPAAMAHGHAEAGAGSTQQRIAQGGDRDSWSCSRCADAEIAAVRTPRRVCRRSESDIAIRGGDELRPRQRR